MIKIEIDSKSGFCFGVVNAIQKAEEELEKSGDTLLSRRYRTQQQRSRTSEI